MGKQQHYEHLVSRYLDDSATPEELAVFFDLLHKGELDVYLEKLALSPEEMNPPASLEVATKKLETSYRLLYYAVAACLVLGVCTAGYYYVLQKHVAREATAATPLPVMPPGTKKAVLTLADGKQLELGAGVQQLQQGEVKLHADTSGLVYEAAATNAQTVGYNTISTPLGGEYKLTLPDGSNAWLNAGTSLRYPTVFNGAERRVELSGEAYFEVTKNAAKPFVVHTSGADVKVLGTHFNVMAYADEATQKTTLAEGAVVVQKEGLERRLLPGQAASVNETGDITVATADVAQDLAWMNGNFDFRKTDLQTIMKQIARWYDLEVRYSGPMPTKRFVGRISRNTNLSDVLGVLRLSGISSSLAGRILTVKNETP